MVEASNLLDEETKKKLSNIYITNVERLLNTPDARKLLGVVIKNKQLILQDPEESLARLALVVSDVANRNIKVTDLDSKEQRINYAQRIAEQPLRVSGESTPSAPAATESEQPTTTPVPPTGTSLSISSSSATPSIRKISPNRNTLIPKNLKLTIPQNRINKIYFELQKLNINDFINSCAVMCRVFIELSVDDFAKRQSITLYDSSKNRPFSLRDKINAVADYLEANKTCSKSELYGVRTLVMKNGHVLSVDSLNAYVHNRNYSPAASDLKANWDSLEIFVKALWS